MKKRYEKQGIKAAQFHRFSNSPQTDLSLEVVIRSFQQVLFSEEKDQKPGD